MSLPAATATTRATWLGRPGVATEWRSTSKATSLRVVHRVLTDIAESTVKLIEGDGRREGFREIESIDNPTDEQVAAMIATLPAVYVKPARTR